MNGARQGQSGQRMKSTNKNQRSGKLLGVMKRFGPNILFFFYLFFF